MAALTYKMTVTLTDGTEVDAGNFTAPQGPAGPAGPEGLICGALIKDPRATQEGQNFSISEDMFSRQASMNEIFIYLAKTAAEEGIGVARIIDVDVRWGNVLVFLPLNSISNVSVQQV